jgi:hypothetical protein
VKNGTESDVDCGGSCPDCATGLHCNTDADCNNARCQATVCQPQTCSDGLKNQTETAIDCGGSSGCPKCGPGQTCAIGTDCDCTYCSGGLCSNAVCGDGIACGTEVCDDGATDACGACNSNCTAANGAAPSISQCRCADASVEQTGCGTFPLNFFFTNWMVGCAGSVPWASRTTLCGKGFRVCSGQEWVDNRATCGPSHNYWTSQNLKYDSANGGPFLGGTCTVGAAMLNACTAPQNMNVCRSTQPDPEGNSCNWNGVCGWNGAHTPNQFFGGCSATAGSLCCPINGCSGSAVATQYFYEGMVGCAGVRTYANRAQLCAPGWVPCKPEQWIARRGGLAPAHHYWTSDPLFWGGQDSGNCSAQKDVGSDCGATPMRVCLASGGAGTTDPEGNVCNWVSCGYGATSPNNYFGGCDGNPTAGTLCCLP